jgi:nickel transport protein
LKAIAIKNAAMVLGLLVLLHGTNDRAEAHRVNVFAWLSGDTVYVESKFSGGKHVKGGQIMVLDPQGNTLLSGLTDNQGEFSFKLPQKTDVTIVVNAGEGHRGQWTLRASEMDAVSSPGHTHTEAAQPLNSESEPNKGAMTGEHAQFASEGAITRQELETMIDTALERKLAPIAKSLAEMQQEGPTGRDVMAGIGYILGLVGIAAYVHSRKRKQ